VAPALALLGTDQIQHIEQPPTLITTGEHQRIHITDTNDRYCWTSTGLQNRPALI